MIRTANLHWSTAASLALTCLVMGCGESGEVDVTVTSAPAPAVPALVATLAITPTPATGDTAAPIVPTSLPSGETTPPAIDVKQVAEETKSDESEQVEYTPPFPDRVELFIPPKREGGIVLKEGGTEDAVELLGFVRLDKQQVVLSVNGQLTRIAQGETQYGIEVISITPPEVVLQRGRQRWQASLEK